MFVHYLTDGIILKKKDIREADQFFTVFTEDFGKISLLARASRKIKSKLRGGLRIFSLSQIEFIQGKNQKTLTDSFTKKNFEKIFKSSSKIKVGNKISEVLEKLSSQEEADKRVWELLKNAFENLNKNKSLSLDLKVYYYFFWNFVKLIGFEPSLKNCSTCSKKVSPPFYFSPHKGGLICKNCAKDLDFVEITADSVKIIRTIIESDWNYFSRLKIKRSHFESIKKITDLYYSSLSESMN